MVQILDGKFLEPGVALMAGFVACLDMEENEIGAVAQGLQSGLQLSFVIRVVKAGGALDPYGFQAGIDADAHYQVHSRDHHALADAEQLGHSRHGGLVSGTPGPDAVGGILPLGDAAQIHGMVGQYLLRTEYEVVDIFGGLGSLRAFGTDHDIGRGRAGHIMRRRALNAFVGVTDLEEMTVTYTGKECCPAVAERFVECLNKFRGFLARDMTGGMVFDHPVGSETDKVAAQGHLVGSDVDSHACGFERTAAFEDGGDVVTKQREMSDFASGGKPLRHGGEQATASAARQLIHSRRVGRLDGCQPSEFGTGFVGHAVAQYYNILHLSHCVIGYLQCL